jgi:hypothetical protein
MAGPDDDLQAWFDGLPRKVRSRAADVVRQEAEALSSAQLARLKSLEQPPDDSGGLEASCQVIPGETEADVVVVAGGDLTNVDGYDHAMGFEFGTTKQPARSFFWSTFRERADGIRERIEDAAADAVAKA